MATKFFTNSGEKTLINKFKGVFEHNPVYYFDALVGFFRASGYFMVHELLQNVGKIRILVGIDVDKLIEDAVKKGLEFNFNAEETREQYIKKITEDIQDAEYKKEVEDGMNQFIKDVASGKIEIKAHPSRELHSKIYIFRPKNFNEHNSGSVITGSSNLTEAGLEKNFEFNVELKDFDDVAYALKTFEDLWRESINIIPSQIEAIKIKTFIYDGFTPFEVYIKFLIEYFGKSIDYDPESITDLPNGYKKLHYQIDAVNDGFNKLMQHNGFILADVVGLGKTIIATIIAKKFYFTNGYRTKTLVVYPPALENSWKKTIRDFEVPNVDFISNGSLNKIKYPEDYDLIIVDEAHKFRSDESDRFNELQKVCKTKRRREGFDGSSDKKIILVTATPLNNKPADIRNQLYLFQDSKYATLEVGNLQHFFRPLIDKYDKLKKINDKVVIAKEIKNIYDTIRTKVLQPIIVRRTRTDIRNTPEYWKDIKDQGLNFPDIIPPKQILYQLDEDLNQLYDDTLEILKRPSVGLGYFRYQAIKFLPKEAKKQFFNDRADIISDQLAVIIRILLVKRIDSSFHAFKMSLGRYYYANTAMCKMIDNNKIYIAPSLPINDLIMDEDEDAIERLFLDESTADKIHAFKVEDFDHKFIEGIGKDQLILKNLVARWDKIDDSRDPKYDEFVRRLKTEFFDPAINNKHKLLIFSESKETTFYLKERLAKDGFTKMLSIDSSNQKEYTDIIAENFDANLNILKQRNDYDIIITTEVLAEGVNLHRSNVIINYDIPWNATRLMQRIGRVNRIGTPSQKIFIYNFFPTVKTDKEIELNKKAYMKLQAFHSALGEDSQIYSTEEEFGTFGLFEKLPEEDRDERLIFLNFLRTFKVENPDTYKRIRDNVPKRARTGRKNKINKDSTLVYIKNNKRDSFYYVYSNNKYEELTFIESARIFEAHVTEKGIHLHNHHHNQVNTALNTFKTEEGLSALGDKTSVKLGPNETKAIAFINTISQMDFVNELEKEMMLAAKTSIRRGRFQKLPREVNKVVKEMETQRLNNMERFKRLMRVLQGFPLMEAEQEFSEDKINKTIKLSKNSPSIIISESFSA